MNHRLLQLKPSLWLRFMNKRILVRDWCVADDLHLEGLMRAQRELDPAWPPNYAHGLDMPTWLGAPCTLGRWVGVLAGGKVIGHAGLGCPEAERLDVYCEYLGCAADAVALICRLVVSPDSRHSGLSSLLTRKALRHAITSGRVPVAEVLSGRGSWLQMMLDSGWHKISVWAGALPGEDLYLLAPPRKFIEVALG